MTKTKKTTAFMLALVTLLMASLMCIPASAATEQAYSCKVSGLNTYCTAVKGNVPTEDNQYFWSWAAEPSGRSYKVVHRLVLHNSNDDIRSDELLTYEGTTHQAASSVRYNHYYHVNVKRQYSSDGSLTLKGTWGFVD